MSDSDDYEDEEEEEEDEAVMQDAADFEDYEIADKCKLSVSPMLCHACSSLARQYPRLFTVTVAPGEVKKAKEKREMEAKRIAKKQRIEGGGAKKPERKPRLRKPVKPTLKPGDLDHLKAIAAISGTCPLRFNIMIHVPGCKHVLHL